MSRTKGPRTSVTHPLRIDAFKVPDTSGVIGMTLCPGRRDRISSEGEWARDLELDLDAVALWKPDVLIALLEPPEFKQLGIPSYAEDVRARGLALELLPIRDGGVPSSLFEEKWKTAGPTVREILRKGGRVLIHCRAGLGRTGTIAARLLVELGSDPAAAISAVRAARPNTIETGSQERHVHQVRPVDDTRRERGAGPPGVRDIDLSQQVVDRALGCFLGLAVGDALGTTLEFTTRDSRSPVTDIVGGGPFSLKPGEWTDDTSMALCLAESLLAFPELDETDLMERFVRWRDEGENSVNGRCFDIGSTTSAALTRFLQDKNPIAGLKNPSTAGNGSLMRLAPIVLNWVNDPRGAITAARRQSATTHAAPAALEACAFFAEVLIDAITTGDKAVALSERSSAQPDIDRIAHGSWDRDREQIQSSGYVVDTLEAAMWAVARASSFEEAVLLAANLGDDADTVAAVTGQLAGAIWGLSAIPKRWLETLAQRDRIEALGRELLRPVSGRPLDSQPDVPTPEASGSLLIGGHHWRYAQKGGIFEIWGPDTALLSEVSEAAREIRALLESDLMTPRVALVPSTYEVLEQVLDDYEVRGLLDDVLQSALRILGVADGGQSMCSYGSGSEYRAWLAFARECAENFLRRKTRKTSDDSRRALADEIVASTYAVAFAMRNGYATLGFTTAVAVASLRGMLPQTREKYD